MNDFEEYFKAGEPGRRERAEAWATAIDEMKKGEYGYHSIWANLPRFIRKSAICLSV